jgi:NTP pyrophosphatase (non-canonical NTP hydrolase)
MPLTANEYQTEALKTAVYPNIGQNLTYPVLGLCGETGEVAEKIKKVIRDNDGILTDSTRDTIALELSDVAWYLAVLAHELGYSLEDILNLNLDKLRSRQERGVLKGSGDNR